MNHSFSAPKKIIYSFLDNRRLILALIKREILGRYQGSVIGVLWSLISPLFMLLIYTFVFSVVFKAKWAGGSDSKAEFALLLFVGLIVFNLFAECINRAPTLIISNINYVKKVIFPLEILPLVSLGAALFHAFVSLLVWLMAYIFLFGLPQITVLLLPLIFMPLLFFILGVSWFLASFGVFLRDVNQFIGMMVSMLMFLSPIFYPISALPEQYQVYLMLNPITSVIEQFRDVLFWGKCPDIAIYLTGLFVSAICAVLGLVFFQKTRVGFADVL
jgi:lipopolysaccharide transport system permease protein